MENKQTSLSRKDKIDGIGIIIFTCVILFISTGTYTKWFHPPEPQIVESNIDKPKKITLEEAAALMRGKLKDMNQGLLDYKVITVDGYDAYIFLSTTMGQEDLWCIQTASPYLTSEGQLNVVSGDCGISNIKRRQWENF